MSDDLTPEALDVAMPQRTCRAYPALLSTDADAAAWAREGAPAGAVVVADYQAAARGRGGLPWSPRPSRDLGFSLVLRPALTPDDEGWLYVAATLAVVDVIGGDSAVEWPDRVVCGGQHVADVAGHAGLGPDGVAWVVVNMLLYDVEAPRAPLVGRLANAIEGLQLPDADALSRFGERCATLGRRVLAHLIPTWPDGVRIGGRAVRVLQDGALVIEQRDGRRIAVRPQHLARLETLDEARAG